MSRMRMTPYTRRTVFIIGMAFFGTGLKFDEWFAVIGMGLGSCLIAIALIPD